MDSQRRRHIVADTMIAKARTAAKSPPAESAKDLDQLATQIAVCRRLLWSNGHEELLKHGETMWLWQLLARIDRSGPITQCDLAYATAQHPAGVSRLLTELEGLGFVVRRRDAADRRRMLVTLTAKGRRHHQSLRQHVYDSMTRIFSPLSADEQRSLSVLLTKITDAAGAPADGR